MDGSLWMDHCGWIIVDGSLRYIHLVEDHKNGEYMRIWGIVSP